MEAASQVPRKNMLQISAGDFRQTANCGHGRGLAIGHPEAGEKSRDVQWHFRRDRLHELRNRVAVALPVCKRANLALSSRIPRSGDCAFQSHFRSVTWPSSRWDG